MNPNLTAIAAHLRASALGHQEIRGKDYLARWGLELRSAVEVRRLEDNWESVGNFAEEMATNSGCRGQIRAANLLHCLASAAYKLRCRHAGFGSVSRGIVAAGM